MFKRFFSKKSKIESVEKEIEPIEEIITAAKQTESEKETETAKTEFEINKVDWLINDSILLFLPRELYMHYWDKNAVKDMQDPSWQNQGIYFWKENEPFEKKSLPPHFENLDKKLFVLDKVPDYIEPVSALAMPWFGMPGGGRKFFLRFEENPITLEEAQKLGALKHVEVITLNFENLSVLNDRDNYQFLIDPNVKFTNQVFYLDEKEVSLAELYQKDKLKIITR